MERMPTRTLWRIAGAGWLAACTLAPSGLAHGAAAGDSGVTLMNERGFSLNTYPRSGTLARVRVRFDKGFEVTLRASKSLRTFGYYTVNSDEGALFGFFMVPAGAIGNHLTLISVIDTKLQTESAAKLHATLTPGSRPVLVITGFPRGATEVEFGTSAAGTSASRITSPCRNKRRLVRGSMLITTRKGTFLPGAVAPGILCGVGR